MAQFNLTPESQPIGSYTGMSQGIYADRNDALGRLFGSLASTLEGGVKAADEAVVEQIEEDVFNEVELVRQEFGGPAATTLEEDAQLARAGALPDHIRNSVDQLQGLQEAYEQGALKQSHYWARLNSVVRQLRGRYPGYRQEIDAAVSSLVGTTPANALQSALFSEWGATSGEDDETKRRNSIIERISSDMGLPVDFVAREEAGNPYTINELLTYQSDHNRDKWETNQRTSELALEADVRELTEAETLKAFEANLATFVTRTLADSSKALGEGYASATEKIQQAARDAAMGRPWDQRDIEQLMAGIAALEAEMRMQIRTYASESWDGNPNHNFNRYISQAEREAAITRALAPIQSLREAVGAEAFNLVEYNTRLNDAAITAKGRSLLDQYEQIADIAALSAMAGMDMTNLYMEAVPNLQNDLTWAFSQGENIKAATGQGNIFESLSRVEASSDLPPETAITLIERWGNVMEMWDKGQINDEILRNNVKYMFTPDATQIFSVLATREDQFEYFRRAVSPRVTQLMMEFRDQGDVESWEQYRAWAATAFINLFQSTAQDLNQGLAEGYDIQWDPANTSFKVLGRQGGDITGLVTGGGGLNLLSFGSHPLNISNLNSAIQSMAPIFEDAGGDVGLEMVSLLMQAGFDPNTPLDPRSPLEKMWMALVEYLIGVEAAELQSRPSAGVTVGGF